MIYEKGIYQGSDRTVVVFGRADLCSTFSECFTGAARKQGRGVKVTYGEEESA